MHVCYEIMEMYQSALHVRLYVLGTKRELRQRASQIAASQEKMGAAASHLVQQALEVIIREVNPRSTGLVLASRRQYMQLSQPPQLQQVSILEHHLLVRNHLRHQQVADLVLVSRHLNLNLQTDQQKKALQKKALFHRYLVRLDHPRRQH